MREAGFPTIVGLTFIGIFAPKGTPKSTINKLSKTNKEALGKPSAIDQFEKLGSQARGSTPEEFTKFMTEQTAIWSEVVKKGNIHIEN